MKLGLGLVGVWLCGATCAFAQTNADAGTPAKPIKIMGVEAANIAQTINGYVQGALHRGYFDLFDRKKGELVTLRLDRIVLDDPERVYFPRAGQVAVCGECSQVELDKQVGRETKVRELGDKYEVWFVMKRGGKVGTQVLDTIIKSVNGNPMFTWAQDGAGDWSPTVMPDTQ